MTEFNETTELSTMNDCSPFLSFSLEELGLLYNETAKLAGTSLAVTAGGNEREKTREKALFKLCGVLKEQIEIRRAAEERLLDEVEAIMAVQR